MSSRCGAGSACLHGEEMGGVSLPAVVDTGLAVTVVYDALRYGRGAATRESDVACSPECARLLLDRWDGTRLVLCAETVAPKAADAEIADLRRLVRRIVDAADANVLMTHDQCILELPNGDRAIDPALEQALMAALDDPEEA